MDRVLAILFAVIIFFVGLAFLLATPHSTGRLLIGFLLLGAALVVLLQSLRRREQVVVQQHLEIGGDIQAQALQCRNCGAALSKENISVQAGAIFVTCPYCHSEYQLEEEPKW